MASQIPFNVSVQGAATHSPDITSFWGTLASLSAFRDWAKLFVLGGALESVRRLFLMAWSYFMDSFVMTAEFTEHDETYTWMMVWLSQQPSFKTARNVLVSTHRIGQNAAADRIPGEDEEKDVDEKKLISFLPTHNKTQYIWYNYTLIQFIRAQQNADTYWTSSTETLMLRMFTRDRNVLHTLMLEAKRAHKKASEQRVNVYVVDPQFNEWTLAGSRPKRPLSSVVLDEGMKELLLDDANDFLASELWYAERGIPWRRGYLLHGCPGSGKTSLIHALAGELGLSIYVVSLSMRRLDDSILNTLISRLPSKSLALMEDIDAAFHRGLTRERQQQSSGPANPNPTNDVDASSTNTASAPSAPPQPQQSTPDTHITLSGILAAIDGVTAQEGRILFATTNKYDALDPALIRPGRLDVHVEFEYASHWQTEELFRCFFPATIKEVDHDTDVSVSVDDDGSSSESESEKTLISLDNDEEVSEMSEKATGIPGEPKESVNSLSDPPSKSSVFKDGRKPCPPMTSAEVSRLAKEFATQIPEREFSMAAIQGHLMRYKTRPYLAITEAASWVEKERKDRRDREMKNETKPIKAESKV